MRQPASCEAPDLASRSYVPTGTIGLSDKGLIGGAGSTFMRMRGQGTSELAFDQDCDRLVALMSIAANRPVAEAEVLPHVMAAAAHWQRGDKALANFRLVFANLPKVADQTSAYRVALAEQLLDNGWSSRGLLLELGLAMPAAEVAKYNPYHVPAGNGPRSGEFDFGPGARRAGTADGTIILAQSDEADEKAFEAREVLGETTPKEELEHGHPITPTTGIPILGGRGPAVFDQKTLDALSTAASIAAGKAGPGKGPVYGTAVHTEFKAQVQGFARDDLHPEQSYRNGHPADYGEPGSIRVDAAEGSKTSPHTVYDLKTGSASLTQSRIQQLRLHLPKLENGDQPAIYEVRP